MTEAVRAVLLLGVTLVALTACAPKPEDDGPLTPIPEPKTNPLVVPQTQDPNGGAS